MLHEVEIGLEQPEWFGVCLSMSLSAPGLLHILHGAASQVLTVTPKLDEAMDGLVDVPQFLTDKGSCNRLLESCFATEVGRQLRKPLKAFFFQSLQSPLGHGGLLLPFHA